MDGRGSPPAPLIIDGAKAQVDLPGTPSGEVRDRGGRRSPRSDAVASPKGPLPLAPFAAAGFASNRSDSLRRFGSSLSIDSFGSGGVRGPPPNPGESIPWFFGFLSQAERDAEIAVSAMADAALAGAGGSTSSIVLDGSRRRPRSARGGSNRKLQRQRFLADSAGKNVVGGVMSQQETHAGAAVQALVVEQAARAAREARVRERVEAGTPPMGVEPGALGTASSSQRPRGRTVAFTTGGGSVDSNSIAPGDSNVLQEMLVDATAAAGVNRDDAAALLAGSNRSFATESAKSAGAASTRSRKTTASQASVRDRLQRQLAAMPASQGIAHQQQYHYLRHLGAKSISGWTFREWAAFRFDRFFDRGRGKLRAGVLLLVIVLQVFIGAALLFAGRSIDGDSNDETLSSLLWASWTYIADPGTHSDESGGAGRVISALVTGSGLLLFALVVAFVVDFIELCLAMQSEGGGLIVVLSHRSKQELEGEIRTHFTRADLLATEIIVRSGAVLLASELAKVSTANARAVLVTAEPGDADASDASVLRTVLALTGMKSFLQGHVVAEVRDIDNEGLVDVTGRGWIETLVSHDIIGRLMVNCARQPGLADVFELALGFEGDEFYLQPWPELTGVAFGDLIPRFPEAIPVGVKTEGVVLLNPPDTFVLGADDELLVLAEDDDTYRPRPPVDVSHTSRTMPVYDAPPELPERVLLCGWRRDLDDIIELMDAMCLRGSELHILSELPLAERARRLETNGLYEEDLENLRIVHHFGNPSYRRDLEPLPLEAYDSVLVLADERFERDALQSDSYALTTLLLVRHLQEGRGLSLGVHHAVAAGAIDFADAGSRRRGSGVSASPPVQDARYSDVSRPKSKDENESKLTARAGSGVLGGPKASSGRLVSRTLVGPALGSAVSQPDLASNSAVGDVGAAQHNPAALLAAAARVAYTAGDPSGPGLQDFRLFREGRRMARMNRHARRASRASSHAASEAQADVNDGDETISDNASRRWGGSGALDEPHVAALPPKHEAAARLAEGKRPPVLCCELLDARTRSIIAGQTTGILGNCDFILSNNIVARIMAMVAERREVKTILNELLGPGGNEIRLFSATKYVRVGSAGASDHEASPAEQASFMDVSLRARRVREVVIGYRRWRGTSMEGRGSIVLNPPDKTVRMTWSSEDKFIVILDPRRGRPSGTVGPRESERMSSDIGDRSSRSDSAGKPLVVAKLADPGVSGESKSTRKPRMGSSLLRGGSQAGHGVPIVPTAVLETDEDEADAPPLIGLESKGATSSAEGTLASVRVEESNAGLGSASQVPPTSITKTAPLLRAGSGLPDASKRTTRMRRRVNAGDVVAEDDDASEVRKPSTPGREMSTRRFKFEYADIG